MRYKKYLKKYLSVVVAVLRSRGFLAESGADLKFELEPGPIFLGRLRLLYFGK